MKKLMGALVLFFALTSCTQVKIAYVDVEEVLREYEGSKKAEEEMKPSPRKFPTSWTSSLFLFNKKFRNISRTRRACQRARDRKRNRN